MIYDYKCANCGEEFEDIKSVAERHTSICPKCGHQAQKLFKPRAAVQKPFVPYMDEHISRDGKPVLIESRDQKKRLLKQNGLDWMPSVKWV